MCQGRNWDILKKREGWIKLDLFCLDTGNYCIMIIIELHILFNYYSRSCQGYSFLDNNFCCEGWCDLNLAETTWKAPLRCIIFPTQTQRGGGGSRINHDLDEGLGN